MVETATCLRADEIKPACVPNPETYVFGSAQYPKAQRGDHDDVQQEMILWLTRMQPFH